MTPSLTMPAPLRGEQLAAIEEAALRILETVGLEIDQDWVRARLAAAGYKANAAGRVCVPRGDTRRFLDAVRQRHGHRFSLAPQPPPADDGPPRLWLDPSWYALNLHDADTDTVVPLTVAGLAAALRLVEALKSEHLRTSWIGQPGDVPAPLRPVMQYWLAGRCLAQLHPDGLLQSVASLPFELELAAALGVPISTAPIFLSSPLRLGGTSLDCAVAARDQFTALWVGGMPGVGATTSLHLGDAFALAAAEAVGAALLLQAAFERPVSFGVSLFATDMRTLQQMPGAPEAYVLQLISGAVNAFIQGTAWSAGSGNLHISACRPGAQAAAEKMAVMAPSALLGVRHFTGAGVLCRDEVFSPAQLLDDLELRDHAARLAAGWVTDCDPARALADVLEAQAHAGFAGLPDTAARYRECYWTPRTFFRGALSHWQAAGAPRADDVHRERLAALRRAPPFVAPADRCRELDRILARAQQALGTAYTPPRGLGEPA